MKGTLDSMIEQQKKAMMFKKSGALKKLVNRLSKSKLPAIKSP